MTEVIRSLRTRAIRVPLTRPWGPDVRDLSLVEVHEAAEVVRQTATDESNIIFGANVDSRLTGQVWVTVIATGLGGTRRRVERPSFEDRRTPERVGEPA